MDALRVGRSTTIQTYLAELVWFGQVGEGFAVEGLAFAKQRMLKITLS